MEESFMENSLHLESVDCENFDSRRAHRKSGWFLQRIFGEEKEKKERGKGTIERSRRNLCQNILDIMFNYEVTSVPCTLPSYLSFLPASFQPLRCREHRQGRVLSTAIPMCVLELSYDTIPQDSQSLSEIISPGVGMQRIVIFVLL